MENGVVLLLPVMVCYKRSHKHHLMSIIIMSLAISCGPPPPPNANSQIASSGGTSLGDETTYSCSPGFFLVGTATIYCQNDGTYSDDAPTCKRKRT